MRDGRRVVRLAVAHFASYYRRRRWRRDRIGRQRNGAGQRLHYSCINNAWQGQGKEAETTDLLSGPTAAAAAAATAPFASLREQLAAVCSLFDPRRQSFGSRTQIGADVGADVDVDRAQRRRTFCYKIVKHRVSRRFATGQRRWVHHLR